MNEFEKQLLADLAVLRSQMQSLIGNGQPGRLQKLEQRVDWHEVMMQRMAAIGGIIALIFTLLHAGIDLLKFNSH